MDITVKYKNVNIAESFFINKREILLDIVAGTPLQDVSVSTSDSVDYSVNIVPGNTYAEIQISNLKEAYIELRIESLSGEVVDNLSFYLAFMAYASAPIIPKVPTGVSLRKKVDSIQILTKDIPSDSNFLGFNFYYSLDQSSYILLNPTPTTTPQKVDFNKSEVLEETKVIQGSIYKTYKEVKTEEKYVYYDFKAKDHLDSYLPGTIVWFSVSAVYFDPTSYSYIESPKTRPLHSDFISFDHTLKSLPFSEISRQSFVEEIITDIREDLPELDVKPGTAFRSMFIDPISDALSELSFKMDVYFKSLSALQLLSIDDADEDTLSDPINTNPYKLRIKEVFNFESDTEVQEYIDSLFDSLAERLFIFRKTSTPSLGTAYVYTYNKPDFDLVVDGSHRFNGASDTIFVPTREFIFERERMGYYYDSENEIYKFPIEVSSIEGGEDRNQAPHNLSVLSFIPGFYVDNDSFIGNGQGRESNYQLAKRINLAYLGMDTGTGGGYYRKILESSFVHDAKVVRPAETFMWRDYEETLDRHLGGSVDIYVYTGNAFSNMELTQDLDVLIQEQDIVYDGGVFTHTFGENLLEILSLENITKGEVYELSEVSFTHDNVVFGTQSFSTDSTDVVQGSFVIQNPQGTLLKKLPVSSINNIDSEFSYSDYRLVKTSPVVLFGGSYRSQDRLYFSNLEASLERVEDTIVALGDLEHILSRKVLHAVEVRDADTSFLFMEGRDYFIKEVEGESRIQLNYSTAISSGSVLLVSYIASPIFTVALRYNPVIQQLQDSLWAFQHVDADVLVKEAIEVPVDLDISVLIKKGWSKDAIDFRIREQLYSLFTPSINRDIYDSDIVESLKRVKGVIDVDLPFRRMARADYARVSWYVAESTSWEYVSTNVWSTPLKYATEDGLTSFNPETNTKFDTVGVYHKLNKLNVDLTGLPTSSDDCVVRGNTLYVYSENPPKDLEFFLSYLVFGDDGVYEFETSPLEYLRLNTVTLNMTEKEHPQIIF